MDDNTGTDGTHTRTGWVVYDIFHKPTPGHCMETTVYYCTVYATAYLALRCLNNTCCLITGYLKPTNTKDLHLLASIAQTGSYKQSQDDKTNNGWLPQSPWMSNSKKKKKSSRSFLSHVQPLTTWWEETTLQLWMEKLQKEPPPIDMEKPLLKKSLQA